MNGIPASIIFDDFKIDGITPGQVTDTLEVFGQDRTYFVFPLKWALTFLPPTGSLTNFIKGGHVRVRTNKILLFTIIQNGCKYLYIGSSTVKFLC